MDNSISKQQIKFAEQLMKLVDMEDMARKLLNLAIAAGNNEIQIAAQATLVRASGQIAAMVISPNAQGSAQWP